MPERKSRVRADFGEAVKHAMGSLSQSDAALRTEISVGYINRMVRGVVPSREVVLRLATGLGANPQPMLSAAGYTDPPPEDDEVLGSVAGAQYYRDLWDRYVCRVFPDAAMPSGAGMPLSRNGIREKVVRLLAELIEARETE